MSDVNETRISELQATYDVDVAPAGEILAPERTETGQWLPGHRPLGGRPRKGESYLDKLEQAVQHEAGRLAIAAVRKAKKGDIRAHVYIRDTLFGVPKQTLEIQKQDDPLAALMAKIGQVLGVSAPEVIEGEAKLIEGPVSNG